MKSYKNKESPESHEMKDKDHKDEKDLKLVQFRDYITDLGLEAMRCSLRLQYHT